MMGVESVTRRNRTNPPAGRKVSQRPPDITVFRTAFSAGGKVPSRSGGSLLTGEEESREGSFSEHVGGGVGGRYDAVWMR